MGIDWISHTCQLESGAQVVLLYIPVKVPETPMRSRVMPLII